MEKLRVFEENDVDSLFAVALKLWDKKAFDYYLTSQQLSVLDQIFKSQDNRKLLFRYFLDGKVFLKFVSIDKSRDTNGQSENDNAHEAYENDQESNIKSDSEDVDHDSRSGEWSKPQDGPVDRENNSSDVSLNESTIPNGVESARNLALKVRYILWDKAIDFLYDGNVNSDEYRLLEDDESEPHDGDLQVQHNETSTITSKRDTAEDDDYDDNDDSDNDEVEEKPSSIASSEAQDHDEDGNIIITVPISETETTQLDNKILIDNFSKMYHSFEGDKETMIKRRKLEENDKLLLEEQQVDGQKDLISMNLGAANLSLKHLLHQIDHNKDKLSIHENELRQLIMDVRKNRSKWASDDKIGQEELYEACEKVVMELRGYTEHSTAFLNKVSKREAPNYLQVIKKPMDLNTILKKLKLFQYKSKAEFADDVMLIWKNCLTYNSDPKHFLRAHAIAMQKKSLKLLPLIPDITIRERTEVEAENEEASTPGPSATDGKAVSKKGKKRTRNGEAKSEVESSQPASTPSMGSQANGLNNTSITTNNGTPDPISIGTPMPSIDNTSGELSGANTPVPSSSTSLMNTSITHQANIGETSAVEDEETSEPNEYLNQEDADKDDLEIQSWKNLTAKARADFCMKRSELFKENKLNADSEAILRDARKMSKFESHLKRLTEYKKKLSKSTDEEPYMLEYDLIGGLPPIPYSGVDDHELDRQENHLVEKVLQEGLKPSEFAPIDSGLNKVVNANIEEMQDIRKICFKISLIRQMQQQQFVHHTQMKPPEIDKINDSIDIDPISRLETHDKFDRNLIYFVLKKRVSKLAMICGFETTEMSAVDTLTQIAGNYMDNLIRTIKLHLEGSTVNKAQKQKNVLTLSLLENGINRPDELYSYITENILKQNDKLKDLKSKLSMFLKTLLRPAFEMSENTFSDNSEQFVSGDFSTELGEDFFGFKELGLDKELGLLGQTIPLHLLHSRFSEANKTVDTKVVQREEFENIPFLRISQNDIYKEIKLFQPALIEALDRTKQFHAKQLKSKREVNEYLSEVKDVIIMDDEDFPKKNNRPRLPPTGKITSSKKKVTAHTFFLPEDFNENEPNTAFSESNGVNRDTVSDYASSLYSTEPSLDSSLPGRTLSPVREMDVVGS